MKTARDKLLAKVQEAEDHYNAHKKGNHPIDMWVAAVRWNALKEALKIFDEE